jgi:RNA polymerase sigma factor (sigma-70 family)
MDREAMAAEVIPLAMAHVNKVARSVALRERLEDVATEAVVRALNDYTAEVDSWRNFAMSYVITDCEREAPRQAKKLRRAPVAMAMGTASDEEGAELRFDPEAKPDAISAEARSLPPELFEPFKLHFVDGYSLEETAKKLGITKDAVKACHTKAAYILAGKVAPPRLRDYGWSLPKMEAAEAELVKDVQFSMPTPETVAEIMEELSFLDAALLKRFEQFFGSQSAA